MKNKKFIISILSLSFLIVIIFSFSNLIKAEDSKVNTIPNSTQEDFTYYNEHTTQAVQSEVPLISNSGNLDTYNSEKYSVSSYSVLPDSIK